MKVYELTFLFEESEKSPVTVQVVEGDSVLDAALDNGVELHHNCGGVCACSTCHVYVEEGMEYLPEITDKEEDFIDRAVNPRLESRLGCQCLIGGPVVVRIPDQSVLLGH